MAENKYSSMSDEDIIKLFDDKFFELDNAPNIVKKQFADSMRDILSTINPTGKEFREMADMIQFMWGNVTYGLTFMPWDGENERLVKNVVDENATMKEILEVVEFRDEYIKTADEIFKNLTDNTKHVLHNNRDLFKDSKTFLRNLDYLNEMYGNQFENPDYDRLKPVQYNIDNKSYSKAESLDYQSYEKLIDEAAKEQIRLEEEFMQEQKLVDVELKELLEEYEELMNQYGDAEGLSLADEKMLDDKLEEIEEKIKKLDDKKVEFDYKKNVEKITDKIPEEPKDLITQYEELSKLYADAESPSEAAMLDEKLKELEELLEKEYEDLIPEDRRDYLQKLREEAEEGFEKYKAMSDEEKVEWEIYGDEGRPVDDTPSIPTKKTKYPHIEKLLNVNPSLDSAFFAFLPEAAKKQIEDSLNKLLVLAVENGITPAQMANLYMFAGQMLTSNDILPAIANEYFHEVFVKTGIVNMTDTGLITDAVTGETLGSDEIKALVAKTKYNNMSMPELLENASGGTMRDEIIKQGDELIENMMIHTYQAYINNEELFDAPQGSRGTIHVEEPGLKMGMSKLHYLGEMYAFPIENPGFKSYLPLEGMQPYHYRSVELPYTEWLEKKMADIEGLGGGSWKMEYPNRINQIRYWGPYSYEGVSRFTPDITYVDPNKVEGTRYSETVDIDTPTNVVDYQDTGVGGRPFEIKDGVPVDKSGNPIKSVGAADETITIYRVVPEGVDSVNANDWVFINKGQAEEALKNANANVDSNFNLIEMEVSQGDVYPSTRGNLEMGYFPKDTPTTEGTVTRMEEYRFKKLIEEVEEATPDVTKITSEQARTIDDALDEAKALFNREKFELIQGSKNRPFKNVDMTYDQFFKAVKYKLVNTFADGLQAWDAYELGLLFMAVADPAIDSLVELVFPHTPEDDRTYFEQVMGNLDRYAEVSPTEQGIKKNKESRARKFKPKEVEDSIAAHERGDISFFEHSGNLDRILDRQKSWEYKEVTPNIGRTANRIHKNTWGSMYGMLGG